MKTVKAITYCFVQFGEEQQKVIGIYAPDNIQEGIDEIKKTFLSSGWTIQETKDCCNQSLTFKKGAEEERIYTGDYILNELNF